MAQRFTYNEESCRYEPVVVTPKAFFRSTFKFLAASLLIGAGFLIYYNFRFDLSEVRELRDQNAKLKSDWQVLQYQLEKTSRDLAKIEETDDQTFRTILEMGPLSQSIREAGTGGREKESERVGVPIIRDAIDLAGKISNRITIEQQSLLELQNKLIAKATELAARPALQPINNHDLTRLNKIFGLRLHPIFNYVRPHNGLDLTAPYGTPVYASADGVVTWAKPNAGYGNVIFVNHGFGFETRYAHLSKYNSVEGQHVKRGQLIGFVGSTGTSTNDHLHYEVLYHGTYVNPIHFLYTDLMQEEYNKVIKAAKGNHLISRQ